MIINILLQIDMRIGYPCINNTLKLTSSKTFRLKSYSDQRLKETVAENIFNLGKLLEFGAENNLLFFRIGSGLIPFGSHPVCTFDWVTFFRRDIAVLGSFINKNNMRVSMHPDQFTLLNAINEDIVKRSVAEIKYHVKILDSMNLDHKHKIQIHVGGAYGDKNKSILRFIRNYKKLNSGLKKKLAIENDDRLFSLRDCLKISRSIRIPIVFDTFHHKIYNNGEKIDQAAEMASKTWKKDDGKPMIDYSTQAAKKRTGAHSEKINIKDFAETMNRIKHLDPDIMLEIKNKEISAIIARDYLF